MKKIISMLLIITGLVMAQGFGDLLVKADAKYDNDEFTACLDLLKKAEKLEATNYEVIWRLARVHWAFSDNSEDEAVISKNVYAGIGYAKTALEMKDDRAESHKWYGILIGRVGELEGSKQKILNSYEVEKHTLKAIELDPTDDGNYHVMGRWNFALSDLSWFEQKIAGLIYATLPEASFEEAVKFFKQASTIAPKEIRHHVWLGKSYEALKNKTAAKSAYNASLAIAADSDSDRILQKEAKEALADL